ncbi:hypothetical protein TNCV_1265551 [Trichonephila clavipes]|nr:hypothetical protein TNCV_1265551 [Trichonephila clavipes]
MNETSFYKILKTFSFHDNALIEKRSVVTCVAKIVPLPEFIDRILSFTKLVRVCAWILRYIKNSRLPFSRTYGYLKSSEHHAAVVTIELLILQVEFPNEIKCLVQGNSSLSLSPKDNKLIPLNLFCNSEGVLQVGGRLSRNTRLSYNQKHPMLCPKIISSQERRKKEASSISFLDEDSLCWVYFHLSLKRTLAAIFVVSTTYFFNSTIVCHFCWRFAPDWKPGVEASLCKSALDYFLEEFFQTQQQGHEQAEEPLPAYVVLRL